MVFGFVSTLGDVGDVGRGDVGATLGTGRRWGQSTMVSTLGTGSTLRSTLHDVGDRALLVVGEPWGQNSIARVDFNACNGKILSGDLLFS